MTAKPITLAKAALRGFRKGYHAADAGFDALIEGAVNLVSGLAACAVGGVVFFAGGMVLVAILLWAWRTITGG